MGPCLGTQTLPRGELELAPVRVGARNDNRFDKPLGTDEKGMKTNLTPKMLTRDPSRRDCGERKRVKKEMSSKYSWFECYPMTIFLRGPRCWLLMSENWSMEHRSNCMRPKWDQPMNEKGVCHFVLSRGAPIRHSQLEFLTFPFGAKHCQMNSRICCCFQHQSAPFQKNKIATCASPPQIARRDADNCNTGRKIQRPKDKRANHILLLPRALALLADCLGSICGRETAWRYCPCSRPVDRKRLSHRHVGIRSSRTLIRATYQLEPKPVAATTR